MATIPELLASLGDTPDAVAASLHAAGIRGKRLSCRACPIAECLHAHNPMVDVRVTTKNVCVNNQMFRLPEPVQLFVIEFDSFGKYPELEAK